MSKLIKILIGCAALAAIVTFGIAAYNRLLEDEVAERSGLLGRVQRHFGRKDDEDDEYDEDLF